MKRLTLVRHAKSSWQVNGLSDHDRPLNKRGLRDCPVMAQRLVDRGLTPDLLLSSTAKRAVQTAEVLKEVLGLGDGQLETYETLYLAPSETLLTHVFDKACLAGHIMVVAHNPGLENLSSKLDINCDSPLPTLGIRSFLYSPITSFESINNLNDKDIAVEKSAATASGSFRLDFQDFPKKADSS